MHGKLDKVIAYNVSEKIIEQLSTSDKSLTIIEDGDHVICAVSGKKIPLEELNYWNVDLQEPYFSYVEASIKKENNS